MTKFCNYETAKKLGSTFDATISLGEWNLPEESRGGIHLYRDISDVDYPFPEKHQWIISPKYEHIVELAGFIKSLRGEDSLLVHCQAGLSRSPAVAILAICIREKIALEVAVKTVLDRRIKNNDEAKEYCKEIFPNKLILKHVGNYLKAHEF